MTFKYGATVPSGGPALLASSFMPVLSRPPVTTNPDGSRRHRIGEEIDVDHIGGLPFSSYGNNDFNDCSPAALANYIRLTSGYLLGKEMRPTIDDVLDLYRRSGNPGFAGVPGVNDDGVDLQLMLNETLANGIGVGPNGLIRPVAFAKLDITSDDELETAVRVFGAAIFAFHMQTSDQQAHAFGYDWDRDDAATLDGYHAVLAGGFEVDVFAGDTVNLITWGEGQSCTASYRRRCMTEAWAVIWPWTVNHPAFASGIDPDALASEYHALTGKALSLPDPTLKLSERWHSGNHVGAAQPQANVMVRRGHYRRRYSADGVWEAVWTPDTDWMTLPNVNEVTLEQAIDNNGITVATLNMDNVAYVEHEGPAGEYHKIERGWFSPMRSYTAPGRPGTGVPENEWDRLLVDAVEIHVQQGYGDTIIGTFGGLVDSATVGDMPDKITLSCRDFGANLVDADLFGWNIDPKLRDPVWFVGGDDVRELLHSKDADQRKEGARRQKRWVVVEDISDMVTTVLRWGGFNLNNMEVHKTGARLPKPISFSRSDTLMTVIRKACDATGHIFYIDPPSTAHPQGRPTFKPSKAALPNPTVRAELRDDKLLTGVQWATDNTKKSGIIRVRGRAHTAAMRGSIPLGGDKERRVTGVYRPPWHKQISTSRLPTGVDRDARVLRHEVHYEPLYNTERECLVACQFIALAMALSATTGTVEIPGYPRFGLDDVFGLVDRPSGLNTRVWVAHVTSTQTFGQAGTYKMSLGVALLDNPDVIEVVKDLHQILVFDV